MAQAPKRPDAARMAALPPDAARMAALPPDAARMAALPGELPGKLPGALPGALPRWHSRGYLPHFEGGSIPQFVTFRLADSLPKEKLREWEEELRHWPAERAETERRRRIEIYLDRGSGEALLRDARVAGLVEGALLFFDGQRYRVHAWVVMPNHVHVLFTPLEAWTLSSIVGSWKSFTATEAGRLLKRRGRFWQEDYFDRFMRNGPHFARTKDYIESNPVLAGLCAAKEDWEFGSARREGQ